jgi:hypothetical protein
MPRMPSRRSDERRKHARFTLPAGYAPITVRTLDSDSFDIEGVAYDLSEGGIRFELDRPIKPGTQIEMKLQLPGGGGQGIRRPVYAFADVVWIEDEEDPGPVKMAATFARFSSVEDGHRLREQLGAHRFRAAA